MATIIRARPNEGRIPAGFPILVNESMEIIEPVFAYLLHLATLPGRSASTKTIQTYVEHLLDWCDTLDQMGIPWHAVTRNTLARYRERLVQYVVPRTKRPYARSTINARLKAVCRFYSWAKQEGLVDRVPFNMVEVRGRQSYLPFLPHTPRNDRRTMANELTQPEHEQLPRVLSREEASLVMAELKPPYDLMGQWALETGMRPIEICALTVYQIPESHGLRTRDHPVFGVPLTVTKGDRPRIAYPPISLLDRTHRYINEVREPLVRSLRRRGPSYEPGPGLFLGIRGQQITSKRMSVAFLKAFRQANVEGYLYCLRHTFAINALNALSKRQEQGEPINVLLVLRKLMGHASIASTVRYLDYFRMRPEKIAEDLAYLYGEAID